MNSLYVPLFGLIGTPVHSVSTEQDNHNIEDHNSEDVSLSIYLRACVNLSICLSVCLHVCVHKYVCMFMSLCMYVCVSGCLCS